MIFEISVNVHILRFERVSIYFLQIKIENVSKFTGVQKKFKISNKRNQNATFC